MIGGLWLVKHRQRVSVESQNKENNGESLTSSTPLPPNGSAMSTSKLTCSESTSHQSFLQDRTPVRGMQDIIGRMRASDQQIQAGNLFFPFMLLQLPSTILNSQLSIANSNLKGFLVPVYGSWFQVVSHRSFDVVRISTGYELPFIVTGWKLYIRAAVIEG